MTWTPLHRDHIPANDVHKALAFLVTMLCVLWLLCLHIGSSADVLPLRSWTMKSEEFRSVTGWRMLKLEKQPGADALPPASSAFGWTDYPVNAAGGTIPEEDPQAGNTPADYAWYAAQFIVALRGPPRYLLHFDSVSGVSIVFVNGRQVFAHTGASTPFDIPLDRSLLHAGGNDVALLVQHAGGNRRRGGIGGVPALIVPGDGAAISDTRYSTHDWYRVTVPCTVLAGLVQNGEYPNLYVGKNLQSVPADRFNGPWWYRTTFKLPASQQGRRVWLNFNGINYRADIWVNGQRIAAATEARGAYRRCEFDITTLARFGDRQNVVAVSVAPPAEGDLAITFVDWNPAAPDRNMGLWQDVSVATSGPVKIRDPYVATDLELPSLASARLTVSADVTNGQDNPVSGVLSGKIGEVTFDQQVSLAAHETRTVQFTADRFAPLVFAHPHLWWPWQLGKQEMYDLDLAFTVDGVTSDHIRSRFGIRKVTSRLNAQNRRIFTVNGVDLLILGAGYSPDLLQRRTFPDRPHWQEDRIRYVRAMNLNTIRLEGKLEDDAFYDLCDKHGVLVMAGWCCCSMWERWQSWQDEHRLVAQESLAYQIRRARTHPAMLAWLNGSDNPPPADIERMYLATETQLGWPCPVLSSATEEITTVSGPSGVKMRGPYGWVPPVYWMTDRDAGGAWGFNTEVGPGATPPTTEGLASFLPAEHQWPMDDHWAYHAFNGQRNMNDFTQALEARYGKARSLTDYAWKAQAQAYESIRAMYEAFSRNKFDATGEIQWMLNNAWPSMTWNLYDYDLRPGGTYFAAKVGSEPVHILYSYDDRSIVVTDNVALPYADLTATVEAFNIDGTRQFQRAMLCSVPANGKAVLFTLPDLPGVTPTYFLRLTLIDAHKQTLSVNSYWLSTKPDVMDWQHRDWWTTPTVSLCDFTPLEQLPRVSLVAKAGHVKHAGDDETLPVTVTNTGPGIAMMVRLKLMRGNTGAEVRPVFWDDGYFLLLPHESRSLIVHFRSADLQGAKAIVAAECFNNR